MAFIRDFVVLYGFLLLSLTMLQICLAVKKYSPPACHARRNESEIWNMDTLTAINTELQNLYAELKLDAGHAENCTYSIDATMNTGKTFVVARLLEKFETMRNHYDNGLWGFCGKEGTDELLESIQLVKYFAAEQKANGTAITLCNRDKLLDCHSLFKKCQCYNNKEDFQNIASKWNSKEKRCILESGSNCPIDTSPKPIKDEKLKTFPCAIGTKCLIKEKYMSCTLAHLQQAPKKSRLLHFHEDDEEEEHDHEEDEEDEEEDEDEEIVPRPGSGSKNSQSTGGGGAKPRSGRKKRSVTGTPVTELDSAADSGSAVASVGRTSTAYNMLRNDYPSIYCQCVGFYRKYKAGANKIKRFVNLEIVTVIIALAVPFIYT